jgi:hypothetical protein
MKTEIIVRSNPPKVVEVEGEWYEILALAIELCLEKDK